MSDQYLYSERLRSFQLIYEEYYQMPALGDRQVPASHIA